MIRKFDMPEFMTVEEATEKYYPTSVVMIRCEVVKYSPVNGYVVAAETVTGEDHRELELYERELQKKPENGEVFLIMTQYPMEGEALFIEQSYYS